MPLAMSVAFGRRPTCASRLEPRLDLLFAFVTSTAAAVEARVSRAPGRRGFTGTHLALVSNADSTLLRGEFDLMVDDLDATHAEMLRLGYEPGEIERGEIHDSFEVRDPGGSLLTFNSSHASDLPL